MNYSEYTGLFKSNNGILKNFSVDETLKGTTNIALICGTNNGHIFNVHCFGKITSESTKYNVAGICGYNGLNGIIEKCSNNAEINNGCRTGGICGLNEGSIKNCYNLAKIGIKNALARNIGAIVGENKGNIDNCYSIANVYGEKKGGIVGENTGTMNNCWYLEKENLSISFKNNGEIVDSGSFSEEQIENQWLVNTLNKENKYWIMDNEQGYPIIK